jgi:cobalt-zinc-cadmium efflux system membrane fusion protein
MKDFTTMNRKYLAAAAAIVLVGGGTGYLLMDGDKSAPGGEQAAPASPDAEAAPPSTIEMSADRIKTAEIGLFKVGDAGFGSEIIAQGSVEAPPSGLAVLTAGADGRITRIYKQIGDPVARGERVATIESREAATISGDLRAARARAAQAKANYERERTLYEAKVTARADLEAARADYEAAAAQAAGARGAAEAAGVSGRFISVRSPISGRVTAAPALLGSYVSAETELFRIADPSVVQAEVSVPVSEGAHIKPGAAAVIEAEGNEISARVRSVTPSADPESRTIQVVLTPTSGGSTLTAGQFIRARIVDAGNDGEGVSVPAEAVQSVGGRDVVFVRTPKGFGVRSVQLGERTSEAAQILNGLRPGEVIAGKNAFLLKAELEKGSGEEE